MRHPSLIVHDKSRTSLSTGHNNHPEQTPPPYRTLMLVTLMVTMLLLPSCHRSGSFNVTIPTVVVCVLSYELTQLLLIPLVAMEPLAPIIPDDTPCQPLEYQIDPALPVGLSLDPITGVISGTPTVGDTSTVHMISAIYLESFEDFELAIVVLPFPPDFTYPHTEVVLPEGGQTILTPTLVEGSGAIDFWSVETDSAPPFSAIVDSVTGELSLFGNGDFIATVTGSNEVGDATFTITVTTISTPRFAAPLLFLDDGDGLLGSGDHIQIETTVAVTTPVSGDETLSLSSGSSLGSGSTTISQADGFTLVTLGEGAMIHARGAAGAVGATTSPPQYQLPSYGTPGQLVATSTGLELPTIALDVFPGMRSQLISEQAGTDIVSFQIDTHPSPEALVLLDGQVHLMEQVSPGNWSIQLIGGSQLISIDAADIDCDGDIDAVAAGYGGIVLLLNQGGALTISTVDSGATTRIEIVDIDDNGTADLVVARTDGTIDILSGDGAGNFSVIDNLATDGSGGIEIVDVDRDGFLDIATAQPALLRGGTSGFSSWSGAPLPAVPCTAVTSIDLDRADGWHGVVWVTEDGDLHRIDIATGSWRSDVTEGLIDAASAILSSDLDRDGGSDLLMATESGIQLHASRGALPVAGASIETAAAHLLRLVGALTADTVDLDGDGDLDLLAVGAGGIVEGINCLEAVKGSLDLDEEDDQDAEDSFISALAAGDLDRDGWIDLVVTGQSIYYEPGVTWILYGGESGSPIPSEEDAQMLLQGVDIRDAAFIDVDRDGDLDILLGAKHSIDRLVIQLAPRQWQVVDFPNGYSWDKTRRYQVGDLNCDGILDVAQACHGINRIWLGDGSGSFVDQPQPFPSDITYAIELVDIDHDGDLDLISGNSTGRHNRIWINDGDANFSESSQILGVMEVRSIVSGDLDGDGDADLILGQNGSGPVGFLDALWLNDGTGTFSEGPSPGNPYETTLQLALGDLDLDGDLDLATATAHRLKVQWNNGAIFSSPLELDNHYHGTVILVDIDGDGDLDLFSGRFEEDIEVWISR